MNESGILERVRGGGVVGVLIVMVCSPGWYRGCIKCLCFLSDHSARQGREVGSGSIVPRFSLCTLEELIENMIRSMGWYDMVTYVDSRFLYMFIWERVATVAPKPVEYPVVEMGEGLC